MNDEKYCNNWRQVRIFTRNFASTGFPLFHAGVTLQVFPATSPIPFFVSHYMCGDEHDKDDTNIQDLPSEFRRPDQHHHSIRIRFRNSCKIEERLVQAIPADCWYSDFRDFNLTDGLANDRFCDYAAGKTAERRQRARIVGNILFYSTRLYLDSIRQTVNGITIETSQHQFNQVLKSPYQAVLHMIVNPPIMNSKVGGVKKTAQGTMFMHL